MVFSSPYFLFVFLPAVLLLIGLFGKRFHNIILLIASLYFYAWGNVSHLALLLISIILNYFIGLLLDNAFKARSKKLILAIGLSGNLVLLGYYKYFNFIMENINELLINLGGQSIEVNDVTLPIGISFFTFQAMSYIVDVYRKTSPVQRNPINLALYISLFPQLIAGPIVRYHDIDKQLNKRILNREKVSSGIIRFIYGLAKKVLIANTFALIADDIFAIAPDGLSSGVAWFGIMAYAFQIYFDFSGYSDMAIGLGRIFGFEFPENFNFPYISQSIKEFWRRWHISLSTWFRDYLYFPLGGNRISPARTYINLFIVFFATGIWHGASWNFVVWGLFHGLFLVIERIGLEKILLRLPKVLRISYTLLVVLVGWVLFRADTLSAGLEYLSSMFLIQIPEKQSFYVLEFLNLKTYLAILFAFAFSFKFIKGGLNYIRSIGSHLKNTHAFFDLYAFSKLAIVLFLFLLSVIYLSADTYNPFIYFRF